MFGGATAAAAVFSIITVFGSPGWDDARTAASSTTRYEGTLEECMKIAIIMNDPLNDINGRSNASNIGGPNAVGHNVRDGLPVRTTYCLPANSAAAQQWIDAKTAYLNNQYNNNK